MLDLSVDPHSRGSQEQIMTIKERAIWIIRLYEIFRSICNSIRMEMLSQEQLVDLAAYMRQLTTDDIDVESSRFLEQLEILDLFEIRLATCNDISPEDVKHMASINIDTIGHLVTSSSAQILHSYGLDRDRMAWTKKFTAKRGLKLDTSLHAEVLLLIRQ